MRLCDVIKYKRQALGMSQEEFGNYIDVSQKTISKFENGEVMSDTVFNKIRTGADDYLASLSRDKYLNVQIKWRALALDEMSDEEAAHFAEHHTERIEAFYGDYKKDV